MKHICRNEATYSEGTKSELPVAACGTNGSRARFKYIVGRLLIFFFSIMFCRTATINIANTSSRLNNNTLITYLIY